MVDSNVFKVKVKQCGRCRKIKPIEHFPFKNKANEVRHATCRPCRNKYLQKYYKENRTKIRQQRKELADARKNFKERMQRERNQEDS